MANESILIFDESLANLKLVRILLEGAVYSLRTATDAEAALATLKSFRPDLSKIG